METKFCKDCGEKIASDAVICPKCGRSQQKKEEVQLVKVETPDSKSGGFAFLCFLIPLLGLILYLIWKDDRPLRASSCGKGALVGVIVEVVLAIIYGCAIGSAIGGAFL